MKKDSIGIKNNKWIINENGETFRLGISQNILTYTNWPQSDGVKESFPMSLKCMLFITQQKYFLQFKRIHIIFSFTKLQCDKKIIKRKHKTFNYFQTNYN